MARYTLDRSIREVDEQIAAAIIHKYYLNVDDLANHGWREV